MALYFNSALLILSTPVFTHVLSSAEFGQVVLYNSWTNVLGIFATLSLSKGVFNNAQVEFEGDIDRYMASMIGLTTLSTVATLVVLLALFGLLGNFTQVSGPLLAFMFLAFIANAIFQFWQAHERFNYRYRLVVALSVATSLLGVLAAIAIIRYVPYRVETRVVITALPIAVAGVVFGARLIYRARMVYSAKYWGYALGMSITLIPHYGAQAVLQQFDRFVIEGSLGKAYVGIYGLAVAVASGVTLLWTAISAAWVPWLLRKLAQEKYAEVNKSATLVNLVVASATIGVALVSPEAVRFLSPAPYHEAARVIPLLVLASYFQFTQSVFLTVQFFSKRPKIITACSLGAAGFNIVLNLVLIREYGVQAAAAVSVLTYVVQLFAHYFIIREMGPKLPMTAASIMGSGSLATAGVLLALHLQSNFTLRYVLLAMLCAAAGVCLHRVRISRRASVDG